MSNRNGGFINYIKSVLGFGKELEEELRYELQETEHPQAQIVICKTDTPPIRRLFLWGWDNNNNPSFAVLYGKHGFKTNKKGQNELDRHVTYTNYMVFSGAKGHFPSFEAVKVVDDWVGRGETARAMYYKKDLNGLGYYRRKGKAIQDFVTLNAKESISLPYFAGLNQRDYARLLNDKGLKLKNFKPAGDPNDVLNLSSGLSEYYETICKLFSNPNIYLRKKCLRELVNLNPPQELYRFLLDAGSGELISGLFLELARSGNDVLIKEAKDISVSNIDWLSESYAAGFKRCAKAYINAIDGNLANERIKFIKENLSDMDLRPIRINKIEIPKDQIIDGAQYRKYAYYGYFSEYTAYYSREQRKTVTERRSGTYPLSYYSDGTVLNIINFKNTLQESEIYGLADVIGKIAYYLDAPRLTYYFKGNSNTKALAYFRRYCRRIMDSYARHDEQKFMEAVKALLASYTSADYINKFKNNFQFNYFIKHYLYNSFTQKAPTDWNGRYEWKRNDQLLKLEGRYEFMPEVWNRHLDDVLEITEHAKITVVLKALYYILNDNANSLLGYPYEKLIKQISAPYEPVSALFLDIARRKLESETDFDINVMISLVNCPNQKIQDMALSYFKRTGGVLSPGNLIGFMFFKNIESWTEFLSQSIERLSESEYIAFLSAIFKSSDKFAAYNAAWTEPLKDIFSGSLSRLQPLSRKQKTELAACVLSELSIHADAPGYIIGLAEEIIFSYPELNEILNEIDVPEPTAGTPKANMIFAFLGALKQEVLPADSLITEILTLGTAKMLKALVEAAERYKAQLSARFHTVLVMLESDSAALNETAKSVFDSLAGDEQRKLHLIIIDSPDKKCYGYGLERLAELYGLIPEIFIIQMLEHPAPEVRQFISGKLDETINNLGGGNKELFMYYAKTLLLLPNKVSKAKLNIYRVLPAFAAKHRDKQQEIEQLLLDLGASNIISDSERALVALARIKKEAVLS